MVTCAVDKSSSKPQLYKLDVITYKTSVIVLVLVDFMAGQQAVSQSNKIPVNLKFF